MNQIITITLNPAIDKTIYQNNIIYDIAGKGINVSKVLKKMNIDSTCIGFLALEDGDLVKGYLDKLGIRHDFIDVKGKVRINTKRIIDNQLYEENQSGPDIDNNSIDELFKKIEQYQDDIVVIAGSVSKNVKKDIYARMTRILKDHNNYVIVDCDNDLLKNVVKEKPDMIKPNIDEACRLFDCEYQEEMIIEKLKELDIDIVLLSKGKDGAILITDDIYYANALDVEYRSAISAGDAMVSSFVYGKLHNMNIIDTFKLSMASSAACVEMKGSDSGDFMRINQLINEVIVNKI